MTIIAGFRCHEGLVLCADTQETIGIAKRNVPKLRLEPDPDKGGSPMAVAFCGATDSGPFVDKLVDLAWQEAQGANSLDEAANRIEESLKRTYKEFGQIFQPGSLPDAELIYGVKHGGRTKLFHARGPIVNEQHTSYVTAGYGTYLADFIASRLCRNAITLRQFLIIAAYVLFQTKEHIETCGGESHIVVLPNSGRARTLWWRETEAITKTVEVADHYLQDLVVLCSDADEERIRAEVDTVLELIRQYRGDHEADLAKWKKALDDLAKP